jgi:hypothetical protein
MSYATIVFVIILSINLILFLGGSPDVNSPMLAIARNVYGGSTIDVNQLINLDVIRNAAIMAGVVWVISSLLSVGSSITGYTSMHTMTVLALAIFITFVGLPNFQNMGFPVVNGINVISYVLYTVFGAMFILAIVGLVRGE